MNYDTYKFSKEELFINLTIIIVTLIVAGRLFYGTFWAAIVMSPLIIPILKQRKDSLRLKRVQQLNIEFKDMLGSLADSMSIGYSVENALRECYKEMLSVYGVNSDICKELRIIMSRIKLNITVESAIEDFATRSTLEDAKMFAQVFTIAKRTGGNMVYVVKNVANNIRQKRIVKDELNVIVSSKKFEQRIMTLIPALIVIYIGTTSSGFLDVMYQTWAGRIIMTICIVLYAISYLWSVKIMSIEI